MTRLKKSRRLLKIPSLTRTKFIVLIATVTGILVVIGAFLLFRRPLASVTPEAVVPATLISDDVNYAGVLIFLKEKGLTPLEVTIKTGVMDFKLGETLVILGLGENLDDRLQTLWRVWREYSIKGKALKKIDLRFSYPLVTY